MKSKKRKAVSKRKREDSSATNSNEEGDAKIPTTLVPCSTITTTSSYPTKQLCFWGNEDSDGNVNWFVVNISIDGHQLTEEIKELAAFDHRLLHKHNKESLERQPTLTPVFSFPRYTGRVPLLFNSFATLGSFLYSLGGICQYPPGGWGADSARSGSNSVYYFDTSYDFSNDYSWTQAPSMITRRQRPQVVTLGRKLYVFGCFGEDRCPHSPCCCVWAEVFDPCSGEWSSIPVPAFEQNLFVCSTTRIDDSRVAKKISALADYRFFYEFGVETRCWTCIANFKRDVVGEIRQPVLVDNVFYWFDNNANAFDMVKDKCFEAPVQDFSFQRAMRIQTEDRTNRFVRTAAIHLGGRYFCLLGYLPDLEEGNPRRIHCLVIKVSTTNECYELYPEGRRDIMKFFLGSHVISCQSFPIDREVEFLDGVIMTI